MIACFLHPLDRPSWPIPAKASKAQRGVQMRFAFLQARDLGANFRQFPKKYLRLHGSLGSCVSASGSGILINKT
jgi:hypothetical protein